MNVNINDITLTSLETISAFDIVTGAFKWMLDELQDSTISNTEEKVDITGKQGRKLSSLKRNKAVTVSGTNGLISGGMMGTQVGSAFEKKVTTVKFPDYLVVEGGKATTTYTAVGTAGNEIETVFVHNADETLGKTFTQAATAGEGTFAYDPASKTITFAEGAVDDKTRIVVFYFRKIEANVLENLSDKYSEKVELYIDAFGEDKCGNIFRVQFHLPKADFSGNFDITMGNDPSVHSFECESLAGVCGGAGALWTMVIFGADAEDVA